MVHKSFKELMDKLTGRFNAFGFPEIVECPDCGGCGTQRVEDFNPHTTMYIDYDVECDTCGGTGEVEE